MKNLFSTAEAAEYLGLSIQALKYHIKESHIKPELVGNSLVFTKEQLDHFNETRRPPGRPKKRKEK